MYTQLDLAYKLVQSKCGNLWHVYVLLSDPDWASVNLGVFVCINCAGIHRRLSVNVSRVRSIRLDTWTKEMVEVSLYDLLVC